MIELLTVADLQRILRCSRAEAYKFGKLIPRFQPPGKRAKWRPEDVQAFVAHNIKGETPWEKYTKSKIPPITKLSITTAPESDNAKALERKIKERLKLSSQRWKLKQQAKLRVVNPSPTDDSATQ